MVSIVQRFEPIDTEEASQQARDTVQKSKEMRAKARRTQAVSKDLIEQATRSRDNSNRTGEQPRPRKSGR